jgi:hypothetical protein
MGCNTLGVDNTYQSGHGNWEGEILKYTAGPMIIVRTEENLFRRRNRSVRMKASIDVNRQIVNR